MAFAPDGLDAGAPALVEGDECPGNGRREVAEDGLGGGMDVERGGDEVEVGWLGTEACLGEVAVLLEVAEAGGGMDIGEVVVADADPVVEALEGVVKAFGGLELDDGQAAVAGEGEEVEHAAVEAGACAGEGGNLGVDGGGFERGVEGGEVGAKRGLKPALRLGAEERVLCGVGVRPVGSAPPIEEMTDKVAEVGFGGREEKGFGRSGAKADLKLAVEGLSGEGGTDAGELETMEEKGELGIGAQAELAGLRKGIWRVFAVGLMVCDDPAGRERGGCCWCGLRHGRVWQGRNTGVSPLRLRHRSR